MVTNDLKEGARIIEGADDRHLRRDLWQKPPRIDLK